MSTADASRDHGAAPATKDASARLHLTAISTGNLYRQTATAPLWEAHARSPRNHKATGAKRDQLMCCVLCAVFPAIDVLDHFGRQRINLDAHRFKLQRGNLKINFLWQAMNGFLQRTGVFLDVLG